MNKSSSTSQLGSSISSTSHDLIDAKLEEHQFGGSKHCPGCGHKLEGKPDWVGLPAGVKFDPTDQELIEHLEAKVEGKESKSNSHPLIDEFIPTIEGDDGICYTHPEKLPGVTRDGLSRHFFHRPSKAYTTGTRKRRKIQTECDLQGGETRWHKTGKTRPVMMNGKQKGCKKILVLYTNFGKNRKPEKTNWVMHQYHLGQNEEEREGELVVSKIFYQTQPRQCNWSDRNISTTVNIGATEGNDSLRERGSGSSMQPQRDHEFSAAPSILGYGAINIQHLNPDNFSYLPYTKAFYHECGNIGEASTAREIGQGASVTCEMRNMAQQHHVIGERDILQGHVTHEHTQHHRQISTAAAFHISRPSHSISAIITPPPPSSLHHTSIILDDDHSFHVSRMTPPRTENFQRSASGLEELIMGCTGTTTTTSTSTDAAKQAESSNINMNQQEAEWLKYSSFWPGPDNPDHHG